MLIPESMLNNIYTIYIYEFCNMFFKKEISQITFNTLF